MNRRTGKTVRSTSPPLQTKISAISNSCDLEFLQFFRIGLR
ncbi:hypothetical protein SLEP1_g48431 [Rubroshorea leprosula]|uniref:Uncharacterized protein n=1 Tax=Rubroshorea leprosula TaxID=152421 RepID=A0AAV5LUH0_9ROSI|nr:hypothetical protein SLEP1_g48431 [Rubroshorea leprosula]